MSQERFSYEFRPLRESQAKICSSGQSQEANVWKISKEEALAMVGQLNLPGFLVEIIELIYDMIRDYKEVLDEFYHLFTDFILGELFGDREYDFLLSLVHEAHRLEEFILHCKNDSQAKVFFKASDTRIFTILYYIGAIYQKRLDRPEGLFHRARWICEKRVLLTFEPTEQILEDIYNSSLSCEEFEKNYEPLILLEDWARARLTELFFLIRDRRQAIKIFMDLHQIKPMVKIEELACKKIFLLCKMQHTKSHKCLLTLRDNLDIFPRIIQDLLSRFDNHYTSVCAFAEFVERNLKEISANLDISIFNDMFTTGDFETDVYFPTFYQDHIQDRNDINLEHYLIGDFTKCVDIAMKANKKLVLHHMIEKHIRAKNL